jgi:hypothetical protein
MLKTFVKVVFIPIKNQVGGHSATLVANGKGCEAGSWEFKSQLDTLLLMLCEGSKLITSQCKNWGEKKITQSRRYGVSVGRRWSKLLRPLTSSNTTTPKLNTSAFSVNCPRTTYSGAK